MKLLSVAGIVADGLHFLPPLLCLFLEQLVKTGLKHAAIGQTMVQAARPRGSIMPLQLAVELDRLGNSQLLEMLSTLGFCVSYDEVVRYKQSVLQFVPGYVELQTSDNRPFMQYVADNVDHNVRTLDG